LTFLAVCAILLGPWTGRATASPARSPYPVTIFGQWASAEKTDFLAIASYCDAHYNTKVTYQQSGADYATELQTRVQGGNPPDVATLSTPSSILNMWPVTRSPH
jgi:ABC-type glycerol-3-phosphate transport system substrate-binding protein